MFDAHMHFAATHGQQRFETILQQNGITTCTLMCIAQNQVQSTVPDALYFKLQHPKSTYVSGSFERSAYLLLAHQPQALAQSLLAQAKALLDAGCDGIKMLEGKPDIRRNFPIPDFDSAEWEPFWQYAEENAVPVTLHVNDPETFWDASKINPYAKSEGWFYGPETINNEEQYRQIAAVLTRHPQLKLQLAHFYFFSAQLPRLCALLEAYPNVHIDLTPGIELYTNLAQNISAARDFFARYGTRILYGSDIGSRAGIKLPPCEIDFDESAARVAIIRRFLETDGAYTLVPDGKYLFHIAPAAMQGLSLSQEAQQNVYENNARAFFGAQPKPVCKEKAVALCEQYAKGIEQLHTAGLYTDVLPQTTRAKAEWFL